MTDTYGRDYFGRGGLNDQVDIDELVDQIGLDRAEIAWRKDFVNFDGEDAERLAAYRETFAAHADQIAEDFYENLTDYEETSEVIGRSPKTVEQLKRTQSAYLVTLADGEYGEDYFRDRARIGKLHDLLEMPMKHYLGQYGVYYELILPLVGDRLVGSLTERLTDAAGRRRSVEDDGTTDGGFTGAECGRSTVTPDAFEAAIRDEVDEAIQDILSILRIINLDTQVVTETYIHSYSRDLEEELDRQQAVASDVEDAVEEAERAATDVADSTEEISEVAQSQADSMRDVADEVGELSATVEEVASTTDEVAATSARAEERAAEGREAAGEAIEVMEELEQTSQEVTEKLTRLQKRADEIDEIVEVIDTIAEETNLLALNANIEAARSEDGSEGFGVVADEIKSLAEESRRHASEIEEMVAQIQDETEETVTSLGTATEEITRGVDEVENVVDTLQAIAGAVEEASSGIQEVSDATDDQAAAAEEIASMVDQQVDQADHVADEIEEIAAANQQQAAKIQEIHRTVERLDGG